jgi:hypothetical protein
MNPAGRLRRGIAFLFGKSESGYPFGLRLRILYRETFNTLLKKNVSYKPVDIDDATLLQQFDDFSSIKDYFNHLRNRRKPLFFNLGDKEKTAAAFNRLYPPKKPEIIAAANRILDHVFDLLGSGPKKLSAENAGEGYQPINWQVDFKSGYTWDKNTWYRDIEYGSQPGVDIKVPWELSRCQHFPTLGKAYLLTVDERYAREFINEIDDWIANNPAGYGVNWVCAMDVAIRVVNWVWGFYFFRSSPALTDEFIAKFVKSLYQHGRYIMGNLEKDPLGRNSNHYLSDLAGLIYLGVFLSELKEARKWRDYALKELGKEVGKQVYPDGPDYEGSTSYHRLVTEIVLSVTLLCRDNDIAFPDWYWQRLKKMLAFTAAYTKPDGKAPQIGDNDNGRLHILSDYSAADLTDHRYLLCVGAALFDSSELKQASGAYSEEAFWLLGEEGHEKYSAISMSGSAPSQSAFSVSGYYVMRRDQYHMIVDGLNPDTKAPSGHFHNSRLSFELYAGDKTFIVDPGTYLYTPAPEMRNLFRSTAYHNTVVVDGEEQNRIDPKTLFQTGQEARVKLNKFSSNHDYDILDLVHTGYERLLNPVIHRRQICFDKKENYWIVRDIFEGKGSHHYDLYLHFKPLEIIADKEHHLVVKTDCSGANLAVIPLVTDGLELKITHGWVSPGYGLKQQARVVKYSRDGQPSVIFCNILYPYRDRIDVQSVIEKVNKINLTALFGGEP